MNKKQTLKQLLRASGVLTAEHGQWLQEKKYKGTPHACVISNPNGKDREMVKEIAGVAGIRFVCIETATMRDMRKYWDNLLKQGVISEQEHNEKVQEY
jgi:D-hexose-6-phosphate mutarotase